ncbi:hypothetical protein AAIH38_36025, partial [Pseudomonas aeruginosa]|uniref:hypothetical protein n=1 Tax=Pseudomonas aeruginosa TaxID=287 RepID=UPI0031B69325
NKSLIALCLSAGLLASAPGISLADVNYVPQNTSDAPAIPSAALQQLTWTPVDQSKTQTTQLSTGGHRSDRRTVELGALRMHNAGNNTWSVTFFR